MGFFSRLSKSIEKVNKGEATIDSISEEMIIDSYEILQSEASCQWQNMAQNIILNAVKATDFSVERAFILIDFNEDSATFDIFYQERNEVVYWTNLRDSNSKKIIETQLLPQAHAVVQLINRTFANANLISISYAELQYETVTGAWFSHIIWSDSPESKIKKEDLLEEWFNIVRISALSQKIDSNLCLPWYPDVLEKKI